MIKKLMQLRNTIVALLGIEFVLALLTYMFLQNRVTLALMIYILIKEIIFYILVILKILLFHLIFLLMISIFQKKL